MRPVILRPKDRFKAAEPPTALSLVQKSQMLPLLQAMLIKVPPRQRSDRLRVTKITPEHPIWGAHSYIRSRRRISCCIIRKPPTSVWSWGRARHLSWQDVVVIDDDLGRSGSGSSRRGFERLPAAICEGRVGSVLCDRVSGLARNGRDRHTLIELRLWSIQSLWMRSVFTTRWCADRP
jgi:hypothetical protein